VERVGTSSGDSEAALLAIVIVMLVILLLAGAVVVYVAYPGRGQATPYVPWVGEAMEKAADALPTLAPDESADWTLRR
jgi:flagellar basal body-associated protein FliL